jgi:hypothetical protein
MDSFSPHEEKTFLNVSDEGAIQVLFGHCPLYWILIKDVPENLEDLKFKNQLARYAALPF